MEGTHHNYIGLTRNHEAYSNPQGPHLEIFTITKIFTHDYPSTFLQQAFISGSSITIYNLSEFKRTNISWYTKIYQNDISVVKYKILLICYFLSTKIIF